MNNTIKGTIKIDVGIDNGGTVETKSFILNQKTCDRLFDKNSVGWTNDSKFNLHFLQHQQNYLNDVLRVVGHLYLNEVYKILGFATTAIGQMVGWIYDENTVIDFGLNDICNEEFRKGNVADCYLSFKNLEFILGK